MKILIDGKVLSEDKIELWKKKRIIKVLHQLKYDIKDNDLEILNNTLTDLKMSYSYEAIIKILKKKIFISEKLMKIGSLLSFNKRRNAITMIYEEGITAETLSKRIDDLMLVSTIENKRVNLSVCPDHYVLSPNNGILEVIETTGNAPLPTQFFITFNEETGIQEKRDLSYKYQSVGVAKLRDGTIIGGVRHQFKDTDTGVEVRLVVEFPVLCPKTIIKQHQKHLAVEWSNWIKWIKEN